MDFLKGPLGDALYAQVEEALKDSDIKLANLAGGEYVAKRKLDEVSEQLKTMQTTLAERDTQLDTLKGLDPEGMKTKIEQLQADNIAAQAASDQKITEYRTDAAAHALSAGIKFTSELARKAFIGDLKTAGLKLDDAGAFVGADDFVKKMRTDNPDAFAKLPSGGAGFGDKNPAAQNAGTAREAIRNALYPNNE